MGVVSMKFEGDVTEGEVLKLHQTLLADPEYNKHYNGIGDQRRANMLLSPDEIEKIAEFNRVNDMIKGRWALLIHAPRGSALGMIYEEEAKSIHDVRIFVTEEAASDYLGFDISVVLL